jgi:hypothetical protein
MIQFEKKHLSSLVANRQVLAIGAEFHRLHRVQWRCTHWPIAEHCARRNVNHLQLVLFLRNNNDCHL